MASPALVLVPTFNECENIEPLLGRVLKEVPAVDVLVIDDSSPDGTAKIVREIAAVEPRVHLLLREKKDGLAGAYIAGMTWGLERDYQRLVQMDADFSHDPSYLDDLLRALDTADMAMGSRYVPEGGTSGWGWIRKCISRGGNIYARSILSAPYEDMTGGFNAWTRKALETIDYQSLRSVGYAFQVELKYRAHRSGLKMVEVPIHFANRTRGKSKMAGAIVWEAAFGVWRMRGYQPQPRDSVRGQSK